MGPGVAVVASLERPARPAGDERVERRLRRGLALALVLCGALSSAGLAWDIQWHTFVGRDAFLTPPHALLYGGVTGSGLVCVGAVLVETWRYRRRAAGVGDQTTVSLLGVFHAPLGFFVAGFGLLVLLIAAPFDNYWHELYGIDVTLWAPFHVMGLVGGMIGTLGLTYALASESARGRWRESGLIALTLFAWGGLLRSLITTFEPARSISPTTDVGPLHVLTLPVALAFAVALVGVAAAVMTGRRWAATFTVALAAAFVGVLALAAPELVRWFALSGGYTFRGGRPPGVDRLDILVPLALLAPAVITDLFFRLTGRGWAAGLAAALPAAGLGGWVAVTQVEGLRGFASHLPPGFAVPPAVSPEALGVGLLAALAAGAGAGWLGDRLGRLWRVSRR